MSGDGQNEDERTQPQDVDQTRLERETRRQGACVIVSSGQASLGKMFKVTKEMIIGRGREADIRLDEEGVSRRHARLVLHQDGSVEIIDLGSRNGTFYNGVKVDRAILQDGARIHFGSTGSLKFTYQDALDEALQRNLYESATRDSLTQLYNRKYLFDVLRKELAYAVRHRTSVSVLMMDVDHFKEINDQNGHWLGDMVLQRVAQKIRDSLRDEDLVARYGGDEFFVLLRGVSEERSLVCAERIRRSVQDMNHTYKGQTAPVTLSLGLAALEAGDAIRAEELIAAADKALYEAKQEGRNLVRGGTVTR